MVSLRFLTVLVVIVYFTTTCEMRSFKKRDDGDDDDDDETFFDADTSFLDDLDLTQFENPDVIVSVLTHIEHAKNIFSLVAYALNSNGQSDYNDELEGAYETLDQAKEKILSGGDSESDEIEEIAVVVLGLQETIRQVQGELDADSDEAEYLSEALAILDQLLKDQSTEGNLLVII